MSEHPQSPLAGLRAARARRVSARTLTVQVGDTSTFVRFRAAEQSELARLSAPGQAAEKTKDPRRIAAANVRFGRALLAETCVGIFEQDADGNLHSADPDGAPLLFGPRLCELLGEPVLDRPEDCVTLIYSDMEVLALTIRLQEFATGGELRTLEDLPEA